MKRLQIDKPTDRRAYRRTSLPTDQPTDWSKAIYSLCFKGWHKNACM